MVEEVLQERGNRYGSFDDNANLTQSLKRQMRLTNGWYNLTDVQAEALEMIIHKIARIIVGDGGYIDSWRDICGFSQLVIDKLKKSDGSTDTEVFLKKRENDEWVYIKGD